MKLVFTTAAALALGMFAIKDTSASTARSNLESLRAAEIALKDAPAGARASQLLATVNYSGTTVGGTSWTRPLANCTGTSNLGPFVLNAQPFSVTVSGDYAVSSVQDGWDGYLFVYQTGFDPTQPNLNCVIGDDDGDVPNTSEIASVALTAGVTYFAVTTGFAAGDEGTFTNTISGPGDINLGLGGPTADLGLTKSAPDGIVNGGTYRYRLQASNAGPDDATGVTVTDTLPAGVSFVSSTCGASAAGQTVTWALGNLANGASASCDLTVSRASLSCSTVVNTATISGAEGDPVGANNSASHSNAGAEAVADGSFEAAMAPAWAQTSSNFGSPLCGASCGTGGGTAGPRTGAQLMWFGGADTALETGSVEQTVSIPSGATALTFGYWLGACGTGGANDFVRLTIGGTEVWRRDATSAECGAAGYTVASIDVSALAGSSQAVRFESTSGTAGDNSNFHIDDVSVIAAPVCVAPPSADLSVSQSLNAPVSQLVGSAVGITLNVANAGPGAASGVSTSTVLPAQLSFLGSSCGATAMGQTVTWSIGALASGASASCTLNTSIANTGPISVSTTVSSSTTDPVSANNTSTGALTGAPIAAARPAVVPSLNLAGLLALVLGLMVVGGFAFNRRAG